jgi:enoyl-CoA hydratase
MLDQPITSKMLMEKDGPIGRLIFNNPARHNAVSLEMWQAVAQIMEDFESDPQIRVIVLSGAGGKAFVSGADISEFKEKRANEQAAAEYSKISETARIRLQETLKPTIAMIRGYCIGGGLATALACDIRIAAENATLGLTEVNLAIIPGGGGTQRLPRLVGKGKALEMILTGARIPAAEALRIGLVERVVPPGEALKAATELARTIAAKAPVALRYAKEAVVKGLELPLADGLRLEGDLSTLLRTTEDRVEGARAFLEKRAPRWTGR